jgi:hypothetical protein
VNYETPKYRLCDLPAIIIAVCRVVIWSIWRMRIGEGITTPELIIIGIILEVTVSHHCRCNRDLIGPISYKEPCGLVSPHGQL